VRGRIRSPVGAGAVLLGPVPSGNSESMNSSAALSGRDGRLPFRRAAMCRRSSEAACAHRFRVDTLHRSSRQPRPRIQRLDRRLHRYGDAQIGSGESRASGKPGPSPPMSRAVDAARGRCRAASTAITGNGRDDLRLMRRAPRPRASSIARRMVAIGRRSGAGPSIPRRASIRTGRRSAPATHARCAAASATRMMAPRCRGPGRRMPRRLAEQAPRKATRLPGGRDPHRDDGAAGIGRAHGVHDRWTHAVATSTRDRLAQSNSRDLGCLEASAGDET
jgi:hypothetical protein